MTVMRRLEPGDPGVVNHKSPTTLLLDPDGEFHSFGFTARDFYHDLSPREARNWLYFDKFKMALHNSKVTRKTLAQGLVLPAGIMSTKTHKNHVNLIFDL